MASTPAHSGEIGLGDGARLVETSHRRAGPVVERYWRLFRHGDDIGGIDIDVCTTCRMVLLGEIGLVDAMQRCGWGSRMLAALRDELTGYRWCTTALKKPSVPFWQRIRERYPDEYYSGSDPRGRCCAHLNS